MSGWPFETCKGMGDLLSRLIKVSKEDSGVCLIVRRLNPKEWTLTNFDVR